MDCDKPLPLTEFDRLTVSESTQMIKAVVPFLDTSTKKTISIFIRFQELMQTIEYFKKPIHAESTTSFNRSNFTMKDILYETMPYFSKSTENTLNTFQNFMDMFNVINMYKDMDQSQDFQSIINMVKNMNDPNITEAFNNMGMDSSGEFSKSDNNMNDNSSKNEHDNKHDNENKHDSSNKHDNGNKHDSGNKHDNENRHNSGNKHDNENRHESSNLDKCNDKSNTDKYNDKSNADKSNEKSNLDKNNGKTNINNINSDLNNSAEVASPFSNMMSAEQKKLYDKYLSEIENINFDNYKSDDIIN